MFEDDNITTLMEEDGAILPDGWQEGDDLFAPGEGEREITADESAFDLDREPGEDGDGDGPAPTTEQEAVSGDKAVTEEAPIPEQVQKQPNKLKFKARVDRQDLDVEVDESELPTLYQKAQVTDRMQAKLAKRDQQMERAEQAAKRLGYDSLDSLLASGERKETADDVSRLEPRQRSVSGGKSFTRDFAAEARLLVGARPELAGKPLPREVLHACALNGKHLMAAYADYEAGQTKAEADRLRRENEVLRQNAAAAARAPVSGTRGGGATDVKAKDDFLRGFDEE